MVRNFSIVNGLRLTPMRSCLKRAGPELVRRIHNATRSKQQTRAAGKQVKRTVEAQTEVRRLKINQRGVVKHVGLDARPSGQRIQLVGEHMRGQIHGRGDFQKAHDVPGGLVLFRENEGVHSVFHRPLANVAQGVFERGSGLRTITRDDMQSVRMAPLYEVSDVVRFRARSDQQRRAAFDPARPAQPLESAVERRA